MRYRLSLGSGTPGDIAVRRPHAARHPGNAQPAADAQLSIFPLSLGAQAQLSTRPARSRSVAAGAPTDARDTLTATAIWNGERQAFNVGVLKQVMLTRGFTAETLQVAAAIGHGTVYHVLAGRPVRLSTARQVLEVLAAAEPRFLLSSLAAEVI